MKVNIQNCPAIDLLQDNDLLEIYISGWFLGAIKMKNISPEAWEMIKFLFNQQKDLKEQLDFDRKRITDLFNEKEISEDYWQGHMDAYDNIENIIN